MFHEVNEEDFYAKNVTKIDYIPDFVFSLDDKTYVHLPSQSQEKILTMIAKLLNKK
jgi:hypothetical protein